MKRVAMFCGIILVGMIPPALAQTTVQTDQPPQFFIVQDLKTKKCSIVSEKPDSTEQSVVGSSTYKTRAEAEAGMKSSVICSMT